MNRKIVEKIAIVFSISMSLCLSSCGQKTENNESERNESEKNGEYAIDSLFCDVDFWGYPEWKMQEGSITNEITKKTGLAINVIEPTQEADTQLKLMLLNDELPDIISVVDTTTISQLTDSGKVWRLDEFLKTYKPDSHILQDFPEDIKKELVKRDGAWYAFPSHINSADARKQWNVSPYLEEVIQYNSNNAIIWNKQLLEQAGLTAEDLVTQEDVMAAFEKVRNLDIQVEGENVIMLLVDGKNYQDPTLKYLEGTFGAEWVDDDGNYMDITLQPQTKNALSFLNTCMRSGYATPDELTMETEEIQKLLKSGRVLCFIGNIANIKVNFTEWVSTGVILSSDGSRPVMEKNMSASTGWISTFISRDCKNPEETAKFLDYMTSEEGMSLWCYGREGSDYCVGEDGFYYKIEQQDKTEELGEWWMFSNSSWERSVEAISDENKQINEVMTAYGKNPETVLYDVSLLLMPVSLISADSKENQIEKAVEEWKARQITKVVLAENEETFEKEYNTLIQGLYERGIEKLNKCKNEGYQENCQEYGKKIQKVNKTERKSEK